MSCPDPEGAAALAADPVLAEVIAIAERASLGIVAAFGATDLAVHHKADDSPQTRADREASALITTALRSAFGEPVVSEEEQVAWEQRRHWSALWLVDPLDGSREFLSGNEEFAVCIARVEAAPQGGPGCAPTHGVVMMPATRVVYAAALGRGAARRDAAGVWAWLPLVQPPLPVQALSRFHDVPAARAFAQLNGYSQLRPTGSALKFGLLAEGSLAVYPRFEECKEWDTAAGELILREAGGDLRALETGRPLVYNKARFPNPPFVASAPGVDADALRLPAGVAERR